jgi:hypothetical protein
MRTLTFLFLGACGGGLGTTEGNQTEFEEVADLDAPVITTTPIEEAQPMGVDVTITATVTDTDTGVLFATLYFKPETAGPEEWENRLMQDDGADNWSAVIPGAAQSGGGMFYYIEAVDSAQNYAESPSRGPDDPYHFRVYAP